MGELGLDILTRLTNVHWAGGTAGIVIQVMHDGQFSPEVTVRILGGDGIIAMSTSPYDPESAELTGFHGITTWIAVNLKNPEVGTTKVEVSCPGTGKRGFVWTDSHPGRAPGLGAKWGYNAAGDPHAVYGDLYPVTVLYLAMHWPDDRSAYYWGDFETREPFSWTISEAFVTESIPSMAPPRVYTNKMVHEPTGWPPENPEPVTVIPYDQFVPSDTDSSGDPLEAFTCPDGALSIEEGKTEPPTGESAEGGGQAERWTYTLEEGWDTPLPAGT